MSDGIRIWKGKARLRAERLRWGTIELMRLLNRLEMLPESFAPDGWSEEFRCYVDRILERV